MKEKIDQLLVLAGKMQLNLDSQAGRAYLIEQLLKEINKDLV